MMNISENLKLLAIAILVSYGYFFPVQIVLSEEVLTAKDELMLTHEQKKDFKKFKETVMDSLVADYMKSDIYLVRTFRVQQYDVGKSVQAINDTLKFRQEYALDGILEEDWAVYHKKFYFKMDKLDKKGRTVWYSVTEHMFIAPELEKGNWRNMTRFILSMYEELEVRCVEKFEDGKKVARFIYLADFYNVPLLSFTCGLCISFLKQIAGMTIHYPNMMYRTVVINVPPFALKFIEAMKSMMTPEDQKWVVTFGTNASIWQPYLADLLGNEEYIPKEFNTNATDTSDPMGGEAGKFMKEAPGAGMGVITGLAAAPGAMPPQRPAPF